MTQRLGALRATGVGVFTLSGVNLLPEYQEVGRRAPSVLRRQHSKVLRVGRMLISGSTNWTTSSRCNREMSFLVELNAAGVAQYDRLADEWREEAEPLTQKVIDSADEARTSKAAAKAMQRSKSASALSRSPGSEF